LLERIIRVGDGKVQVKSGEWVQLSDKLVIMGVVPKRDDLAHIHTFGNIKIVYDITPHKTSNEATEDEVAKQIVEFEDLLGGY
jgi:hypothetical protein